MASVAADVMKAPHDRQFLGHPRGLGILSFSEAWERFSYYGMQALLVLYASKQLFQAGHVERIWGFGPFRGLLEGIYGPLSPQALAGTVAGLYSGFVYLTPIGGGLLADRLLGRTRTVVLGASTMALGHFLMAFDQTFLIAILCLLLGVGCFKGNIATQVGDLYAPNDLRRADAFQIYMLGIQLAVIVAPIVCGYLGEKVAWHYGFGAAGIGMLIGLAVYLSGRKWLPAEPPRRRSALAEPRPKLAAGEGKRIAVLVALVPVFACMSVGNQQMFVAYELWGDQTLQLTFWGWAMPVTFLQSLDAFVSTITMILVVAFWRWWSKTRREPNEVTKVAIGGFIAAFAPLALAVASAEAEASGAKASIAYAFAFHIINDFGFAMIFPVGLALYSRAAPKAVGGTMIAVYYLNLFLCGLIVARLAGMLGIVSGFKFWMLHAIIIAGATVVMLIARRAAGGLLAPDHDPEAVVT